ncbi:MAG: hypothetical protein IPM48_14290 [Saprospiraceae bacterium]|nr:hypothetical protein [Saprospiraceae bacterium]
MHDYKIQILEAYIENPSEASEAFKRLATFGKIASFLHYHFSFIPVGRTSEKFREYRHSIWNMISEEYLYNLTEIELKDHIIKDLDKWAAIDHGLDHVVQRRHWKQYGVTVDHQLLPPLLHRLAKED